MKFSRRAIVRILVLLTVLILSLPSLVALSGKQGSGVAQGDGTSRVMVDRTVLGEMFTATWCQPCISADAGMDMVLDDPAYFDDRFVVVEYHSSDDFAIPEAEERQNYYLVNGVPTVVFDGKEKITGSEGSPEDDEAVYKNAIDGRPASSDLLVNVTLEIDGTDGHYSIEYEVRDDISLTYQGLSAYGVVVEDHDTKLASGHILRMTAVSMPVNDDGVQVRFEGDKAVLNGTFDVDPDWSEEDLAMVAWLQSESNREVLQAGIGYPEDGGDPAQNSPPQYIGGDLDFSMEEDTVDTHIDLTTVFSDPDGDKLFYGSEGSTHIQVSIKEETKNLKVMPVSDWYGTETVYISARDSSHSPVTHPITVTVTAVNDPPRVIGELTGLDLQEDASIITSPLTSIFEDPDGDDMSFMVENMAHINVMKNSDQTLSLEPQTNWNGAEAMVVVASDGEYSTEYEDDVVVRPVNDEPVIEDYSPMDWGQVEECETYTMSVDATDIEGDSLTYTWQVDGRPTAITTSSFTYKPSYGDSGDHTILVEVSDGSAVASQAFQVTVIEGNRPPTVEITNPQDAQTFDEDENIVFISEVDDPDDPTGRDIEYRWEVDGVFMSNEPQFTKALGSGTHTVVLTVDDGEYEDSDTVTFKVRESGGSQIPGFGPVPVLLSLLVVTILILGRELEH